ncbi:MAG: hypothetical protein LBJ00_02450 [Planctomycetaceae bacterium]|nr:hypothetical protein [Planctomycetaceae bacterium]
MFCIVLSSTLLFTFVLLQFILPSYSFSDNEVVSFQNYTASGKAVGFALEQPLRDVTLACSASGILEQLEYISLRFLL